MIVFLLISTGHIYSYASAWLNTALIIHTHSINVLRYHQLANNDSYFKTSHLNDKKQSSVPYNYHLRKRSLDFQKRKAFFKN